MTSADDSGGGIDKGIRDLEDLTNRLIATVGDLAARVNTTQDMQSALAATMERVEQQQKQQTSQRRINQWLGAVMVMIICLSGAVVFALYRIDQNADKIGAVSDRTSNRVLCPLYGLLVSQIEGLPANAADEDGDGTVTSDEQAALDETVRVIREGYAALDCAPS